MPSKLQSIFCAGKPAIFVGPRDNEIAKWIEESGGGWIAEEDDLVALLKAINEAGDPGERERRGLAALTYARNHFDMLTNCQSIIDLLLNSESSTSPNSD